MNEGARRPTCGAARYILMDRSAERRFGPFAVGDYREILGRRFKIIGTTSEAASFTTAPIVFMDFGNAQELQRDAAGKTQLHPGQGRAGRRRAGGGGGDPADRLPYNDVYTKRRVGARARAPTGSSPRASA